MYIGGIIISMLYTYRFASGSIARKRYWTHFYRAAVCVPIITTLCTYILYFGRWWIHTRACNLMRTGRVLNGFNIRKTRRAHFLERFGEKNKISHCSIDYRDHQPCNSYAAYRHIVYFYMPSVMRAHLLVRIRDFV